MSPNFLCFYCNQDDVLSFNYNVARQVKWFGHHNVHFSSLPRANFYCLEMTDRLADRSFIFSVYRHLVCTGRWLFRVGLDEILFAIVYRTAFKTTYNNSTLSFCFIFYTQIQAHALLCCCSLTHLSFVHHTTIRKTEQQRTYIHTTNNISHPYQSSA